MSDREMRQSAAIKYKRLPEIQQKKLQLKTEQEKQTNRLMSRVFAKVLYEHVKYLIQIKFKIQKSD